MELNTRIRMVDNLMLVPYRLMFAVDKLMLVVADTTSFGEDKLLAEDTILVDNHKLLVVDNCNMVDKMELNMPSYNLGIQVAVLANNIAFHKAHGVQLTFPFASLTFHACLLRFSWLFFPHNGQVSVFVVALA
jgi:hypothetical protein